MQHQRRPVLRAAGGGLAAAVVALSAGCGSGSSAATQAAPADDIPAAAAAQPAQTGPAGAAATATSTVAAAAPKPAKPELRIAMGEWAVVPEARAIPPGPVTLVISNRGKVAHGFELKAESGRGRDDGGRLELHSAVLAPGKTVRLKVNLPAGLYEIECFVADHDDRGMQGLLEARRGAPRPAARRPSGPATGVTIDSFAFSPRTIRVSAGETVTWRNADAAPHTVTASPDGFTSRTLRTGDRYARRFAKPGRFSYLCALHPGMKGVVDVKP